MSQSYHDQLHYQIYCSRWPGAENQARYNSLFTFWDSVWSQTFKELKGQDTFYSDDFDRQDEVSGLFHEDHVVGAFIYNWYDLNLKSHQKHSYFRTYPKEALDQIQKLGGGRKIMTMGNLAVHPEWRKPQTGGLISDVLLGLGCQRFLDSDADILIAYTRNDRKVNELCYRHGARCVFANHIEHNVKVDIIAVTREDAVVAADAESAKVINSLWARREVCGGEQLHLRKFTPRFAAETASAA